MRRRQQAKSTDPFSFTPVFRYALPGKSGGGKPDKKPGGDVHTTQMVGEEGEGTPKPPPGGKTTTAIGEEGPGSVPTTTIAKGEEA